MESGRIFFDTTSGYRGGNMLFLGNGDSVFQGNYYRLFGNFVLIIIILRFLV